MKPSKKVKVKAIFIGQDGSLNFRTRMEYTLIIIHKKDKVIQIKDVNGIMVCAYDSMVAFLENWDNIRRV